MIEERLYVGRDAICQALQVSWQTVRRWILYRGLPVLQERGFQPSLHSSDLRCWHRERQQLTRGKRSSRPIDKADL